MLNDAAVIFNGGTMAWSGNSEAFKRETSFLLFLFIVKGVYLLKIIGFFYCIISIYWIKNI